MNQIREFENLSIWQNVWVCFLVRLDSFSLNTSFPEKKKKKLKESIPGPPQDSYFQESNRKSAWVYTVILLHFYSFWDSVRAPQVLWAEIGLCPFAVPQLCLCTRAQVGAVGSDGWATQGAGALWERQREGSFFIAVHIVEEGIEGVFQSFSILR